MSWSDIVDIRKKFKKNLLNRDNKIKKVFQREKDITSPKSSIEFSIWVAYNQDPNKKKSRKRNIQARNVKVTELIKEMNNKRSAKIIIKVKNRIVTFRKYREGIETIPSNLLQGYTINNPYVIYPDDRLEKQSSKGRYLFSSIRKASNRDDLFFPNSQMTCIYIENIDQLGIPKRWNPKIKLLASHNAPLVNFRYLEYKSKGEENIKDLLGEIKLTNYLSDNFKEDSCVYTVLINAYRDSFIKAQQSGRYKDVNISIMNIYGI